MKSQNKTTSGGDLSLVTCQPESQPTSVPVGIPCITPPGAGFGRKFPLILFLCVMMCVVQPATAGNGSAGFPGPASWTIPDSGSESSASGETAFLTGDNSFEGSITLSRYTVRTDGSEHLVSSTPLLIHPGYILLVPSTGESIEILNNMRAEGIIVRQGREDFVFLTADRKAVIMSKQELKQMITMLDAMRGRGAAEPAQDPEISLESTGERKQLEGYRSEKWIASQEGSDSEWHVWVTDQLSIPWGVLSEQWLTKQLALSGLPAESWFVDEMLPVRAELWTNGTLAEIVRIEDISPRSLPESHFQIPGDYQQITFQQMLFDRMRNR